MQNSQSVDKKIKECYELLYFKRNFKIRMRDAISWGLDRPDVELLEKAWQLKAEKLGAEGMRRFAEVMHEIKMSRDLWARNLKGKHWQDEREISKILSRQSNKRIPELELKT